MDKQIKFVEIQKKYDKAKADLYIELEKSHYNYHKDVSKLIDEIAELSDMLETYITDQIKKGSKWIVSL